MENQFKTICNSFLKHDIPTPSNILKIAIENPKQTFVDYYQQFLAQKGQPFIWNSGYQHIVDWLGDNNNKGLFISGDCGLGKTFITQYIIPAILLQHYHKILRCYSITEINKNIDAYLNKNILGIDDVGTEDVSNTYGNKRMAFPEIMDSAEKNANLIIATSNLSIDQMQQRYGARTLDRLIACTKYVEIKGNSLRK